ncbi:MAG TPA: AsmA-like C-terminal region-containing protein [Xanthobacteraceae bacterium]
MQTTLLGIAIAIILALVSALVGPLLIDWGSYRAEFEQHARRLTGLDVRISGAIDARLLPTPTLVLQGIEFGNAQEKISARALRVEFSLGALARGEWRISDAQLEGPQLAAGLDVSGQLTWPVPGIGFDPESVAIERLTVRDARATLSDARSGGRVVLDKLEFTGDLRSLAGPIKGAGSFILGGRHYPYRVTTSRIAKDGPVRVRLALDPIEPLERPMTAEADVSIWIDQGRPHYEGTLQLARLVGRAPAGGNALITEPWRLSSRISGDSRTAAAEQIDFQYGPDERALKLRGSAKLTFERKPDLLAALSSPQIDLDRLLALPEPVRRRPLLALKKLAESFTATVQLPFPATLSLGIDTLALGGAALQRVGALIRADGAKLDVSSLEFRAPGATQVNLKGQLAPTTAGLQFIGSSRIEAGDPRALLAWLTDRSDAPSGIAAGAMRLTGDVSVGNDGFKIDSLNFELDRVTVAGRLSYAWAAADRPARIGVELTVPEIDLDRLSTVSGALLGDAGLAWPREGALAVKIGRATIAGVEARQVDVKARIDAKGLEIDRCAIDDFGGAKLAIQGRIDTGAQAPRGTLTLDLDAHAADGMIALATKLAPRLADPLRRSAGRMVPASLHAALKIDPGIGSTDATATYRIYGNAGGLRVALDGSVNAARDAFRIDNLAALRSAKVNLDGRIEADDTTALLDLLQVDRVVALEKRPGRLAVAARGPLDGGLAVQAQFAAGAFNLSTSGSVRLADSAGENASLKANLAVKVDNAPIRSPHLGGSSDVVLLPTSGTARVALESGKLRLTEVRGMVAGTAIGGRLTLGMQQPISVEGDLELSALDLAAVVGTAMGMPTGRPDREAGWPSEPFEPVPLKLSGEVRLKAARVVLSPKLAARDVTGVLRFAEGELAWQAIDGVLAGGRITGELVLLRRAEEAAARGRVHLAGANSAELAPGEAPVSGRLTLELTAEGTGMSPVAVIGSLNGGGTFTLENGRLARLDPAAFGAVTRAVDQGLPIDPERVRERMETALAAAPLALARADGAISINSGQATLTNTTVQAKGADLGLAGIVDLREGTLDARLTLQGTPAGFRSGAAPQVVIALKGPISAPKRTVDVAALASWLALRAVEQQSSKLDVLEGRQPPAPVAAAQPNVAGAPVEGPELTTPHTGPAGASTGSRAPHAGSSTARPFSSQPRSAAIPSPPKARSPAAEQAQPLDIRPAMPVRPLRPQNGASQTAGQPAGQASRPPPVPPRPRSLSEFLFGR